MRKYFPVNVLPLVIAATGVAGAQGGSVPGRDLLTYPLALVGEAPALPGASGVGQFNPAAAWLPDSARWLLAVGSMSTPSDAGASGQLGGVSTHWRGNTITVSIVRASVSGLVRTDSDPLTIGDAVPYFTLVGSVGAARRVAPHLTVGAAARVHAGRIDQESVTRAAFDGGFVADGLTRMDIRIAASSYLLTGDRATGGDPTLFAAVDARVLRRDPRMELRVGMSAAANAERPSEQYAFASLRVGPWDVRGGPVRTTAYGDSNVRHRLGVALRYGGYALGLARESSPNGLGPTYQFVLRSVLK